MIRLENVNKYFNRFKKNQLHVINNTNITFSSSGLVALLGPSGCGKTTLLNVIGGLDKVNSGNIYIDGEKITKRGSKKVDKTRNLNIGYIFQDYKLVENMTVFENVAISLKILGIKDKEEISKRVLYVLDKVKLTRYKNRPVNMLSGGERQRVGIARALVKDPKIIIADEPTGNLDSKNSLEVMNIIKSISSKYLVVLVTHEEELAKFYADRIIEIKDGKIVDDYVNDIKGSLNYKIENRIYLKDFKDIDSITKENTNISIYRDNSEKLDINVVFKNGNIYIETKGKEKVEVIENNSNIELINDHYKEIKNIEINENTFEINKINNKRYTSIFKLASFITYGFKKTIDYPILKKILLAGFFLSGMFIYYAISSIFATTNIEDKNFITMNKSYLTASVKNLSVDDFKKYENLDEINFILPSKSIINLKFMYDKYLQTTSNGALITGSLSDIESISKDKLILGRKPNNKLEVVIDKMVLEKTIKNYNTNMAGYFKIEDYLNHDVEMKNLKFKIIGISDMEEPNIYASKEMFVNMISNTASEEDIYSNEMDTSLEFIDYELLMDKEVKLIKGNLPKNDYEIIVNKDNEWNMPINKEIDKTINNKKLKVVGYYENTKDKYHNLMMTNNNTIKYNLIAKTNYLSISSNNQEETLNYFYDNKINIKNSYDYSKSVYINEQSESIRNTLILSGVILLISLIEIFLMIRSSFLSRIKEVGIYRAIGVKKSDIYKMFAGEIFAITLIASVTGISFMTYILYNLNKIAYLKGIFMVNVYTYIISIILVFAFNLLVGLLPVFNTIRKTPAQILSRFDVD